MAYVTTLSSSGQITLPKTLRNKLCISAGDQVVIDEIHDQIVLKSRRQELEETFAKLDALVKEKEQNDPEFVKAREKYSGMTFNEVRDAYDATPEGRKEFKERYGLDIK